MRRAHVWMALALAATWPANAATPTAIIDLGWTLQAGAWMAEHGRLLADDPFTTAPKAGPWINQQWLAQLLYHLLHRLGGLEMVVFGTAVIATATYALVLAACRALGSGSGLASLAVLGAYVLGATNLGARAQTLAYPIFATFVLVLTLAARSPAATRPLWALPALEVVWANLHGSFVLGPALVAAVAAGASLDARSPRAARPYLLPLVGCLAACLATPYGPRALVYLLSISSHPLIREVLTEWAPLSLTTGQGLPFALATAGTAWLLAASPRRPRAVEWLPLVVFGVLALTSARSVVWWGLLAAPVVARHGAAIVARRAARRPLREVPAINLALLGAIGLIVVLCLPWTKGWNPLLPPSVHGMVRRETPTAVADYLRDRTFDGALFNMGDWGGYFDLALWPRHRPFVDGRVEIYHPAVWDDYVAITTPTADWQALLDRHGIGYVVIAADASWALPREMRASGRWREVYADEQALVLVREAAASSDQAERTPPLPTLRGGGAGADRDELDGPGVVLAREGGGW